LQPIAPRILGGQYCKHTRSRLRRYGIHSRDDRVRVRRAQHYGVRETLESEIVEINRPGR